MSRKHKTRKESNGKNNQKSSDVRTYCNNLQINYLFIEYEIVTNEVQKDIEQCIKATGCSIPKSFQRNERLKWRIEKINYLNDESFHLNCYSGHRYVLNQC